MFIFIVVPSTKIQNCTLKIWKEDWLSWYITSSLYIYNCDLSWMIIPSNLSKQIFFTSSIPVLSSVEITNIDESQE